jgi:hypothetical protein
LLATGYESHTADEELYLRLIGKFALEKRYAPTQQKEMKRSGSALFDQNRKPNHTKPNCQSTQFLVVGLVPMFWEIRCSTLIVVLYLN